MSKNNTDHTKVAPTAWGVAYLRSLTDIPYAKEFHDALSEVLDSNLAKGGMRDHLAPQLEARYKLLDKLIEETGITQIIELAAGVATRGLDMTTRNKEVIYVQTDLPNVLDKNASILEHLSITPPRNLHIVAANALDEEQIRAALVRFDNNKPIVITHEGLMRYLTFDEKTRLATTVRSILRDYGGKWITPDISMRAALSRENERAKNHTDMLKKTTGIDIEQNVFENPEHAIDFFGSLGFDVERHSFLEVTVSLTSPSTLGISETDVKRLNEPCIAFVMSLR